MIHGIDTSALVATELISHSRHTVSRQMLARFRQSGDQFALAPQVLAEFVHIITDSRRCTNPLDMTTALQRAEALWNATEVVQVYPTSPATDQFFAWMKRYQLGRKRLLDTLLSAIFSAAGIGSVITLNPSDFALFGCFTIHEPT